MGSGKVTLLAELPITGSQTGAWVPIQRTRDSVGAIQIVVDGFAGVTNGSLLILGRPSPEPSGSALMVTFVAADLQVESTIEQDVFLLPQMQARLLGGVSAPEATVRVYLME